MNDVQRYGPWALVTGASDGIGRALSQHLAAQGLNVVLVARRRDALATLAADLSAAHSVQTNVLAVDLADPAGVTVVEEQTRTMDIGIVVLAAGFGTTGTVLETSADEESALVAVNVTAVMRLAHTFASRLVSRGTGALVLFGSIVGWQGVPGQANYAASKAYVQSLAEGLHGELRPFGVDVLAVAPGPVGSGFGPRAGLALGSATSPDTVARSTLAALGRRRTVVPGLQGTFLTAALRPLPRRLRSAILSRVIAGMRLRSSASRPAAEQTLGCRHGG